MNVKKYNLLVPLAGNGQRFLDKGFSQPKYLITAYNKHLIDWAMQSIDISECNLIFCLRQDHISNFGVDEIFKNKFGDDIKIVKIDKLTEGSLSTCLLAKDYINDNLPLFIYTVDVNFEPIFKPSNFEGDGLVLTFKSNNPAYSYVKVNENNLASLTAEKNVISNNACVGLYGFKSGKLFVNYAEQMIQKGLKTKNEYYITPVYNLLIEDKLNIYIESVKNMYIMGTPDEYNFFKTRVLNKFGEKSIALSCDHSGFELKEKLKNILNKFNLKYIDFGCYINKNCDQFDYVSQAIQSIQDAECNFGIGICHTGQAINISANKFKDIRSALIYDEYSAEYSIKHNCCNFFSIPSKITTEESLEKYINIWLNTKFEGGRHCNRIQKIENIQYGNR